MTDTTPPIPEWVTLITHAATHDWDVTYTAQGTTRQLTIGRVDDLGEYVHADVSWDNDAMQGWPRWNSGLGTDYLSVTDLIDRIQDATR